MTWRDPSPSRRDPLDSCDRLLRVGRRGGGPGAIEAVAVARIFRRRIFIAF